MPRQLDFADGFESSLEPTSPGVEFTIPDNQAVAAAISGLVFSGIRHAWALMSFYRRDSLQEKAAMVLLHVQYKTDSNAWSIEPEGNFDGLAAAGITLSIDSSGQVKQATSDFVGTGYSSKGQFVVLQQFAV